MPPPRPRNRHARKNTPPGVRVSRQRVEPANRRGSTLKVSAISRVAEGHAERPALDGREHSGRLVRSGRALVGNGTIPRGSSPSCAQIARHEIVFGRPARIATTMQACASAAKLREGGPILNRGARTIVQHRVAATSAHQLQLGRHSTMRSLRASATITVLRVPPRAWKFASDTTRLRNCVPGASRTASRSHPLRAVIAYTAKLLSSSRFAWQLRVREDHAV